MPSKVGYTINMVNEDSDPQTQAGTASSTKAHYRRVKKFCTSTSPPVRNYERCGYNAGFTPDADGMYSFGFIGAPEYGTFNDFYDVCNMCMAEDRSEEFVVQFLREKPCSYVNMAVTFVKGLSEKNDGKVVFDGGKYSRDYADGSPHKCTVEDERFEIGMKIDFTWGFDYLESDPKVVKCKGLCINMPGFQMEIVGDFEASKNQQWDDKSRDFFMQTFNFRLHEGSEECYIRFARNHEEANKLGDHTIVTRDFRQRLHGEDGSNGIDLDFTVRHRSKPEPQASMEVALQQESISKSFTESPVEEDSHPPQQESISKSFTESPVEEDSHPPQQTSGEPAMRQDCDPSQREPQEKEIRFFDHPEHKLLLAPQNYYKDNYGVICDACMESLQRTRWLYICPNNGNSCEYAVHAACAQFPRRFQHPSHPMHTLKLRKLSPGLSPLDCRQCDVCEEDILRGLHYHCAKCDFDAHVVCPGGQVCDPPQQAPEAPEEELQRDSSQHLGMTPQQYSAYQTQLLEQQRQTQLLEQQRQTQLLEQQRQTQLLEQQRQAQLLEQQRQAQLLEQQRQAQLLEQRRQAHLLEQRRQLQAIQLQARRIAAIQVNSLRAASNLIDGSKTCYRGCWPGYCTC